MADEKKKKRQNKTASIKVMLTPEKKVAWREKATLSGIPLSKLIYDSVDNKEVQTLESTEAIKNLTIEIRRIGNNLNQITRWANTYKGEADAKEIASAINELDSILRKLTDAG